MSHSFQQLQTCTAHITLLQYRQPKLAKHSHKNKGDSEIQIYSFPFYLTHCPLMSTCHLFFVCWYLDLFISCLFSIFFSPLQDSYPGFFQLQSFLCFIIFTSWNNFPSVFLPFTFLLLFNRTFSTLACFRYVGILSVLPFSQSLSPVWPSHLKLNIDRPIYFPAVPGWFKYWQQFWVSTHRRPEHCEAAGVEKEIERE